MIGFLMQVRVDSSQLGGDPEQAFALMDGI
jgi:hypothetical protein